MLGKETLFHALDYSLHRGDPRSSAQERVAQANLPSLYKYLFHENCSGWTTVGRFCHANMRILRCAIKEPGRKSEDPSSLVIVRRS